MNARNRLVAITNFAIVVVALLLGIVCVKKYLLTPTKAKPAEPAPIVVGTRISIPDVEWSRSRKTMVVALHRQCPFCSQSAPFYKRLVEKVNGNQNLQLLAVLPHDPVIAHQYLDSIGVAFTEVRSSDLSKIGVSGTPTILLLNDQGAITASWVGALSVDQENEMLRRVEEIAMN
jgi:hypothetical protein